jgi:hypothetical protein
MIFLHIMYLKNMKKIFRIFWRKYFINLYEETLRCNMNKLHIYMKYKYEEIWNYHGWVDINNMNKLDVCMKKLYEEIWNANNETSIFFIREPFYRQVNDFQSHLSTYNHARKKHEKNAKNMQHLDFPLVISYPELCFPCIHNKKWCSQNV